MPRARAVLFACALAVVPSVSSAGDPQAGKSRASPCRVCHGLDGVGTNPMVPNIGGESFEYLTKQLKDFREGRRVNEQMSIMAADLTDEDIANLAAWYSRIEVSFTIPQ